nr:MAG TPA: hypothetical protein [Caudoviricetes sp.]
MPIYNSIIRPYVMGYPEGWGVHSPHPFGEPSPSRWR